MDRQSIARTHAWKASTCCAEFVEGGIRRHFVVNRAGWAIVRIVSDHEADRAHWRERSDLNSGCDLDREILKALLSPSVPHLAGVRKERQLQKFREKRAWSAQLEI